MLEAVHNALNRLAAHGGFRRYFANTSWMFGEQILRMAAGLLVGIWVVRYLGPEQFGIYSYALAFTGLFGVVARLGLDGVVVRDLVQAPEQRDAILGTAFWLKLLGAGLALTLIGAATFVSGNDATTNLYIFIIASGIVLQAFEVVEFYFQARVLSKFISMSRFIQLLASSLFKIYLVLTGKPLVWFVFSTVVDQVSLAITSVLVYRYQKAGSFFRTFDRSIARRMLADSWPLIFTGLVVTIYMRIDQVMIKEMMTERDVGLYASALKISEIWYFVPTLISTSLFPAILNAKKASAELYARRLRQLMSFTLWLSAAVAVPLSLFSDAVVVGLFGEPFRSAGTILLVHCWTGIFVSLGVTSGRWYLSENLQKYSFYRTFLGALVNVGLNFVLIPLWGTTGAAVSTIVAQVMAAFLFDALSSRTRPLFWLKVNSFTPTAIFVRGTS